MLKGIKVDLTLRDNSTGAYLRIPVVPATIPYMEGERLSDAKKILNLGDVDFLNGVALDAMEWQSFFPARYDPGYCAYSNLLQPTAYKDRFRAWKDAGTSLQVICPAAGINVEMYLKSFNWELKGFEGDIHYYAAFRQNKNIRPKQIAVQVDQVTLSISAADKKTPESRSPIPEKPTPKTYTVKSGDSLSLIAKRLGVSSWRPLYEANKSVIGADPNKIYPGQVLSV
jgi:LysM repeat protein